MNSKKEQGEGAGAEGIDCQRNASVSLIRSSFMKSSRYHFSASDIPGGRLGLHQGPRSG
ncbi:hypothetical protein MASR1M66_02120 [Aminivibrio sp.]